MNFKEGHPISFETFVTIDRTNRCVPYMNPAIATARKSRLQRQERAVGDILGLLVGAEIVKADGFIVGLCEGAKPGLEEGDLDGEELGLDEGCTEGEALGLDDGDLLGPVEGD